MDSLGNKQWSKTFGGSQDEGRDFERWPAAAPDLDGSVFVTGQTSSRDFPTTPGAYMASNDTGAPRETDGIDAFVTKLDSTGSRLVYSTFLGGQGVERIIELKLEAPELALLHKSGEAVKKTIAELGI